MPAFVPKRSRASLVACACVAGSCSLVVRSRRLSPRLVPSLAQLAEAFLRPVSIWSAGTPAASNEPRSAVLSWMLRPMSRNVAPLALTSFMSVDTSIPVFCATVWNMPRTFPASEESTLKAFIDIDAFSIALFTSTPVFSANLRNCRDVCSSESPVSPNRVLTSPTALPISSKSAEDSFATFSKLASSSSAASPVAPVCLMTASAPSSTSLNAPTAAVAMPVLAAVIVLPTVSTFAPCSAHLSALSWSDCPNLYRPVWLASYSVFVDLSFSA